MIQLEDVGHVAYEVPDLALAEAFLLDFGFEVSARTDDRIYFRAASERHHVYVAIKGEASRFLGTAFDVASREMLEQAAAVPGASPVHPIEGPGGGARVTLTTPCGHTIWLEHGVQCLAPMAVRDVYPLNFSAATQRLNRSVRQRAARVPVLRFGHFVLQVPDATQLSAISRNEAAKEIRVQTNDWNRYRRRLSDRPAKTMERDDAAKREPKVKVEDKSDKGARDVLRLSKGQPGSKKGRSIEDRVQALEEELIARERALNEANQRIRDLEKRVQEGKK